VEISVRFEVSSIVVLVFWVVTLCGLVGRYQCFGGSRLKVEAYVPLKC
jgi:hypothetical protein